MRYDLTNSYHICTYVFYPRNGMLNWIARSTEILELTSLECENIGKLTKLSINGYWCGVLKDPIIFEYFVEIYNTLSRDR